jgi:RNA polymerase sigma factor (sigma-70 family)
MALITPARTTQVLTCVQPEPSHEQRFLDALPIIESVIRDLGRRYRLSRDEQEEFGANVKVRLIDRDYAVLRRFEGRSSLATFLRTVITRQFLDERIKAWGRWRPSADAVRLGPTAVVLERMLERQHLPLDEAIEALLSRDPSLEEDMLRDLAALLPNRVTGRRLVDDTALEHLPTLEGTPEQLLEEEWASGMAQKAAAALRAVIETLPSRDRLLLRLRYEQGTTVADIAKVLGEEQKPLYRQLDRLLQRLRRELEAHGVCGDHVRGMVSRIIDDRADAPGSLAVVTVSAIEGARRDRQVAG